jgi:hypothetical protein
MVVLYLFVTKNARFTLFLTMPYDYVLTILPDVSLSTTLEAEVPFD